MFRSQGRSDERSRAWVKPPCLFYIHNSPVYPQSFPASQREPGKNMYIDQFKSITIMETLFITFTINLSFRPYVPVFLSSIHVPITLDFSPHGARLVLLCFLFSHPLTSVCFTFTIVSESTPHPLLLKYHFFHGTFK